jgi:hypothetical protein
MFEAEGYFGKYKAPELLDYKKSNVNILEVFKGVQNGKVSSPDLLIPMYRWYSNHIYNINNMQNINRYFFWVKPEILSRMLVLGINRNIRFIKTLPKKTENDFDFIIPYICRYYKWSRKEFEHYKQFFDLGSHELHLELDRMYSFEKQECRKLGIKRDKIKTKFEEVRKTKSFF